MLLQRRVSFSVIKTVCGPFGPDSIEHSLWVSVLFSVFCQLLFNNARYTAFKVTYITEEQGTARYPGKQLVAAVPLCFRNRLGWLGRVKRAG